MNRSTGMLVAMAAVGSAFVIVLGAGFRITNSASPIGDGLYYGAIILFALVIVGAVKSGWVAGMTESLRGGRLSRSHRMRIEANQRQWDVERRRRLEALAADPVKRKYAERIERGESWSDEQIAYDLDAMKLATCVHLQPIERAMRAAGIDVRLGVGLGDRSRVRANCRVDPGAVTARFSPPPFVEYATPSPVGRAFEDPLPALIKCWQCASEIHVVHRLDATAETPVFPPTMQPDTGEMPAPENETLDRFAELRLRMQTLPR